MTGVADWLQVFVLNINEEKGFFVYSSWHPLSFIECVRLIFKKCLGRTTILIYNEHFGATSRAVFGRKLGHYIIIISKVFLFLFLFYQNKRFLHPKDSRVFLNLKNRFQVRYVIFEIPRAAPAGKILYHTLVRGVRLNEIERSFAGRRRRQEKKMIKKVFLVFHASN